MAAIKKWVAATLTIYLGNVIGIVLFSWLWPERATDSLSRLAIYSGIAAVFLLIDAVIYIIMRWDER